MGVATLNNSIYAVGGYSGKQNMVYSTARQYNMVNGEWESIKSMNLTREKFGLGILNDKIYAVSIDVPQ